VLILKGLKVMSVSSFPKGGSTESCQCSGWLWPRFISVSHQT